EAEWRLGHADAALSAADLAYESSVRMGAFSIFKRALGHFPAVLTRLLQHSPDATKWRRVTARPTITVSSRNWNSEGAVFALIQPFGASPDIVVNGHPAGIRRLKMVELASYLASWPSGVGRDDILLNLFPESDRSHASNHFRQVVHQMRKTTGLSLQRLARSRVAWSETVVVDTVDRRFELALNEANMQVGELRLDRMVEALDLVVGPYLASSELQWVTDRRFQLEILQEEAELETARLALELQDFESARRFGEEVLARNPYSEPAYQVMIGIDLAVGTETAALATYRRAVSALRDIGLEPGRLTLQLVKESAGGDRDALPMASISRADAI
ncbi:MAG TPA: BTAD domain-containing putative transcriptional regulator, partial [Acidimicrobiales bacterium]|nr:BTAD domain-containing putative transcriptional regulator [Acidimicrobiales bacterium]